MIGRRELLAGAGGAALGGGTTLPAAPAEAAMVGPVAMRLARQSADADLLAACKEFEVLQAEAARLRAVANLPDGSWDDLNDRFDLVLNQLAELPAVTPAGLRAKAQAARGAMLVAQDGATWGAEENVALSLLDDMVRLAP